MATSYLLLTTHYVPLTTHRSSLTPHSSLLTPQVLIFDEADQLLDMGFRPAIDKILRALKSTAATRQTLLFSATMPQDVAQVARIATRDAKMVDTVGEESNTNAQADRSGTPLTTPLTAPHP